MTRQFRRCRRRGDWLFYCDDHRTQPVFAIWILVFTVFAGFASIFSWFGVKAPSPISVSSKPIVQPPTMSAAIPDTVVPVGVALSSTDFCPGRDPTDPSLPQVEICVVYWCKGPVYSLNGEFDSSQVQLKIRPRIINNSPEPLSIALGSRSSIRLLIDSAKYVAERWNPPRKTLAAGDRPIPVEWNGRTYWGIPPNQVGDAYIAPGPVYTGYATVWDGTVVAPGQSYFKPLRSRPDGRGIREGDLVFQVPVDEYGKAVVVGLAIVTFNADGSSRVAAIASRSKWPPPINANEF